MLRSGIYLKMKAIGFGDKNYNFAVYIGNIPPMSEYQELTQIQALQQGEIESINQACGNGWRKVFNVYAKVLYALDKNNFGFSALAPSWQEYRDKYLLQADSKTGLLFSPPKLNKSKNSLAQSLSESPCVHVICGKTHAKDLIESHNLALNLHWLDDEFAIDIQQRVVVCPYFDYRQLSNIKVIRLAELLSKIAN